MSKELVNINGAVTNDYTHIIQLTSAPAANNYMTFESPVGTDFVVPASHVFVLTALISEASTANTEIFIGYGTAGVPSQAGAPTGNVVLSQKFSHTTAYYNYNWKVNFVFAAGVYPYVFSYSYASAVTAFGILIPTA